MERRIPESAEHLWTMIKESPAWDLFAMTDESDDVKRWRDQLIAHLRETGTTAPLPTAGSLQAAYDSYQELGDLLARLAGTSSPTFMPAPTFVTNAWALTATNHDQIVLFSSGLASYLQAVIESIVEMSIDEGAQPSLERIHVIIAAAGFLAGDRSSSVFQRLGNPGNSTPMRTSATVSLLIAMTAFFLAHEFAHHELGHTGRTKERTIDGRQALIDMQVLVRSREQELAADQRAFELFMNICHHHADGLWVAEADCAPIIALDSISIVEDLFHLIPDEIESTHPLARTRRDRLYGAFKQSARPEAHNYYPHVQQIFASIRAGATKTGLL